MNVGKDEKAACCSAAFRSQAPEDTNRILIEFPDSLALDRDNAS
jgi:hypothetical protein